MKKCIAILLVLVMVCGLAASAVAETGQYRMTRLFIENGL